MSGDTLLSQINKDTLGSKDIPSTFLLLMDEINSGVCKEAIQWIIETNYAETKPQIMNMMICSPGGDLASAFALIDVMRGSSIPIRTIGLGQIASAGLMIFIAGKKGQRILTENTSILSHQWSAGSGGKEHELFAAIKEFDLTTKRMIAHYKKCSKISEDDIRKYLLPPQDVWLDAKEAHKFGLCDEIKTLK
jgi:ATP-dependent Clp protease protease subunit